MDRQLKQTAFFGTERRPGSPQRHYHAAGSQTPLPDIASRVVVGWGSEPTSDTQKGVSIRPVSLVNQAAARALPAGVARVDQHNSHALERGLVADQLSQLGKAPIRHPRPLVLLGLDPIPDAPEVFKGNEAPAAFSICDDGFAQDVVRVALEPRLLAGSAPERTLRGTGADLLQGSAAGMLATANVVNLLPGVGLPGVSHGQVDDTHVHADCVVCADHWRVIGVACDREHPLATHEHQVDLALGASQHSALVFAACKRDTLPTFQGPDRHGIAGGQEAEDTLVVGLSGKRAEGSCRALITNLEGVGDLGDASHGGLRSQAKAQPHLGIADLVQVVLPGGPRVSTKLRQPVAGSIAPFQRAAQQHRLFLGWQQPDRCDKLQRSDALLRFDVAPHDSFGHSPNAARVVAAAPKRREAGSQRREAENGPGIVAIALLWRHAACYTDAAYVLQACRATARPAIPPSAKADGFSQRVLMTDSVEPSPRPWRLNPDWRRIMDPDLAPILAADDTSVMTPSEMLSVSDANLNLIVRSVNAVSNGVPETWEQMHLQLRHAISAVHTGSVDERAMIVEALINALQDMIAIEEAMSRNEA